MALPIRVICPSCLESVETSVADGSREATACPSCGSPLDPAESGHGGPTVDSSDAPTHVEHPGIASGRINRFILRNRIGGGGYGDVYAAFDPKLERDVAIKILKPTKLEAKATERFLREARAAARLNHPNIVALIDAGQDSGRLWIAYRLIEGRPLSKIREGREPGRREVVLLIRRLADALGHAHAKGIYHRDLKPANVIIDEDGSPHLTDFGLARRVDVDSDLTGEGTVLGTPAYMSPEQASGNAQFADARSDIYSLGVILYELLCRRRPTNMPSNTPFWKIEWKTPPPAPQSLDRGIPRDLDRVCMKALAYDPADRHQSADEFAAALDRWLALEGVRHPGKRALAGILGVGLVATIALALLRPPGLPTEAATPASPTVAPDPVRQHLVLKPAPGPPEVAAATLQDRPVVEEPAPAPASVPGAAGVVVNVDKRTIHLHPTRCSAASRIRADNRREFASRAEAEAAGFLAVCQVCRDH